MLLQGSSLRTVKQIFLTPTSSVQHGNQHVKHNLLQRMRERHTSDHFLSPGPVPLGTGWSHGCSQRAHGSAQLMKGIHVGVASLYCSYCLPKKRTSSHSSYWIRSSKNVQDCSANPSIILSNVTACLHLWLAAHDHVRILDCWCEAAADLSCSRRTLLHAGAGEQI